MNKQIISKLSLFLTGLEQRLVDNKEYFREINASYKSGTKEYKARAIPEDNKIKINFNGNTEVIEMTWLSAKLSKYAENYDSVVIAYEERGTVIYIEADNKNVKMKTKETEIENVVKHNNETAHIGNRDYYIKLGKADHVLREIGILGENGKIKNDMIRKYNQIDHFVEVINDLLIHLARSNESITVLDCGCGKSYLLFVLNYYIKEVLKKDCHFIGIDYSGTVVEASKRMAKNLDYRNMEFKVTDIKNFSTHRKIDLVISLHACDTATDEAIAVAVRNNVKTLVVVPCCQREILNQYSFEPFSQITKHGILKARLADVLTDGIRALLLESLGYRVSVAEYISPLETPKNLMIKAEKVQDDNKRALEEYKRLKELLNISPTLEKLILYN
jgi:SAM-dependent methyltransferase